MFSQLMGYLKILGGICSNIFAMLNRKAEAKAKVREEKLDELEKGFETRNPSDINSAFSDI